MKRVVSIFLCIVFIFTLSVTSFAEENNAEDSAPVSIRTREEFLRFAISCASDLASRDKTFVLEADIDLSGADFYPVPYFAGNFDGQGHTVSGLLFNRDGSRQGLFRVIAESGVVQNLKVSGSVTPGGTAACIGGIAGENRGMITDCSFEGTVSGIENVGGIVGLNTAGGTVSRCVFSGSLTAEHQAGGIAGRSDGTVSTSVNRGAVNTVAIVPHEDTGRLLERRFDLAQLTEDEFLNLTNIGGIVGDSTGIIDRCRNAGAVGYRSTGYNVGGIAGKSSGFVNACRNTGSINGRRDVGGIVGQLIPFSDWDLSSGKLDALSLQIAILNGQLAGMANNAGSYGSSLFSELGRLQNYTVTLRDSVQSMIDTTRQNEQKILDSITVDAETGEVRFTRPDLDNVNVSAFTNALSNLYAESFTVADLAKDSVGTLAADLQTVSGQLSSVFDTLFSTVASLGDVTAEREDLSETEAYTRNTGAVADCVNRGCVTAEINAGGVLGNAGFEVEFDMEDTLNVSDYLTSNARQDLFAAVRDCTCEAESTARTMTAGGIAGNMDIGVVIGSTVKGLVSAENGDYAGGLVGLSSGSVLNSRSRVLLSGGKYVGGIAGFGHHIRDCRAWVRFEDQKEYAGSIAGWANGELSWNYYVNIWPAGVDGISIYGETVALSEENFLALEDIPEDFGSVRVCYQVENRIIAEETVPFGGIPGHIPTVDNRDGAFWQWELPEGPIYVPLTVEGRYLPPKTVLATAEDQPRFLVEGEFYEDQALKVEALALSGLPENAVSAWTLTVPGYDGSLTVRMLRETDGTLLRIGEDGGTEALSCVRDGRYLVFELPNGGSFCLLENPEQGSTKTFFTALIVTVLLLALAGIVVAAVRSGKKKKEKRGI
ncbi:MAG: hypothetical protein IJQ02_03755 [Oscillospiraceae bacterium]|nr:hypothetical protein [Oscillospiraceae bacterium]